MVLSFQSPFTCMNHNDQWAFFLLLGKRVYKVKWLTQVQEPESRSPKNTAMVFATSCVDCFYLPSHVHLVLCTELLICSFFNSNGSKGWQNYSAKIQNFLAMIFKQKFYKVRGFCLMNKIREPLPPLYGKANDIKSVGQLPVITLP